MRIARKILLLAMTALAAMAFAATTASADTPIEVENEAGGHCNPCTFHVEGESHLARLDTGAIVSACHDEFIIDIYENGSGEIEWHGETDQAIPCGTTDCTTMSDHWPFTSEEIDIGTVEFQVAICLKSLASGAEQECSVDVIGTETGVHSYAFTASQACPSGVRVEMDAAVEGGGPEIHHL